MGVAGGVAGGADVVVGVLPPVGADVVVGLLVLVGRLLGMAAQAA